MSFFSNYAKGPGKNVLFLEGANILIELYYITDIESDIEVDFNFGADLIYVHYVILYYKFY